MFFEFVFVFVVCDQCIDIQREQFVGCKVVGDIIVDNLLGKIFDDGCFIYIGFIDEYWVVFCVLRKNVDDVVDFFFMVNDGINFIFFGYGGYVDGEFGEIFVFLFCVGIVRIDMFGVVDLLYSFLYQFWFGDVGFFEGILD